MKWAVPVLVVAAGLGIWATDRMHSRDSASPTTVDTTKSEEESPKDTELSVALPVQEVTPATRDSSQPAEVLYPPEAPPPVVTTEAPPLAVTTAPPPPVTVAPPPPVTKASPSVTKTPPPPVKTEDPPSVTKAPLPPVESKADSKPVPEARETIPPPPVVAQPVLPVPPPAKGVTLFEHGEFRGRSERITADDPDLRDNPLGNDQASSVRVDPGCEATLYRHVGYEDKSLVLTGDASTLRRTPVRNDEVSSIKVRCH